MKLSEYGSPVFDAKGIREGPGYRPIGKSGSSAGYAVPQTATPAVMSTKGKHGDYVGTRAKKFIQIPENKNKYDPTKGTPLSKPDATGNDLDTALGLTPVYAEPINGTLVDVMTRVNNREYVEDFVGRLTASEIDKAMKSKIKSETDNKKIENMVLDYIDAQAQQRKEGIVKGLQDKGFTKDEATKAYEESRKDDAKKEIKFNGAGFLAGRSLLNTSGSMFVRGVFGGSSPGAVGVAAAGAVARGRPARREESSSSESSAEAVGRPVRAAAERAAAVPVPKRKERLRAMGLPISDTEYAGGPRRGATGHFRISNNELYDGDTDAVAGRVRTQMASLAAAAGAAAGAGGSAAARRPGSAAPKRS